MKSGTVARSLQTMLLLGLVLTWPAAAAGFEPTIPPVPPVSVETPIADPPPPSAAANLDPEAVKAIIADYLKEQEAKKKAEEEQKKSEPKFWVVGDDLKMTSRWNHGLHVESEDKAFRIHPVGRLQFDEIFMTAGQRVQFEPGGVGRVDDATAFRRLRIGVEGTLWEIFDFWVEPDFFNVLNAQANNEGPIYGNTPAATDMWGQWSHIPFLGNLRFGSVKPAYSFEHLTSSRFLDYLERSLMFDAFVGGLDNGFQPGFVLWDYSENERLTWQLSYTRNVISIFGWNIGDGEFNYSGRITGLPIYEDGGRELLHLGVSYSHRQLDDEHDRFRARVLTRNGPGPVGNALVDLRLAGQNRDMIIPELVMVNGPWSFEAEYAGVWVNDTEFPQTGPDRTNVGTQFFQGGYVSLLYFLTGESRPYDTKQGVFTRVVPFENFFLVRGDDGCFHRGWGAWQVGARYSFLDLNSQDIGGGMVHDLTVGINWFWNPNMKWQYNYSLARRDVPEAEGNGIVQGFGIRFAMDW